MAGERGLIRSRKPPFQCNRWGRLRVARSIGKKKEGIEDPLLLSTVRSELELDADRTTRIERALDLGGSEERRIGAGLKASIDILILVQSVL